MTELKTLEDIQNLHGFHNLKQHSKNIPECMMYNKIIKEGEELAIFPSELRYEAIKDIKAIFMMEKTPEDKLWEKFKGKKIIYSEEGKLAIINYIKWKFNITEEDLKGGEDNGEN